MKKLLLSLALVLGVSSLASAVEVSLPAEGKKWNDYTWNTDGTNFTGEVEGYSILLDKAAATNALVAPDQYSIRVYQGAKITFTTPADVTMTQIVLNIDKLSKANSVTASAGWTVGESTGDSNTGWTLTLTAAAPQTSITLEGIDNVANAAKQLRIASMVITASGTGTGGGPVNPPTPTEAVEVSDIAAALAQATGTKVKFTNDVTVVFQHQSSLYLQDATAKVLAYGALTQTYASGTKIKGFEATVAEYKGNKQLTPVAETFTEGTPGAAVEPTLMQIEEVSADMLYDYVQFKGVEIAAGANARTFTMSDASGSIQLYQNWTDIEVPTGTGFTVTGFVGTFNGVAQIYAASVTDGSGPVNPPVEPGGDAKTATFNFNDPASLGVDVNAKEDDGTTGNYKIDYPEATFTVDGVTLHTVASGNPSRMYQQPAKDNVWTYRIYKNSVTTISAPAGCKLTEVLFNTQTATYATALGNCTFSAGTFEAGKLTLDAASVEIANPNTGGATIGFNSITVTFTDPSGVEGIEAENAPVEYFNLQGVRVAGDITPGLYIRRQGNSAVKVIVK